MAEQTKKTTPGKALTQAGTQKQRAKPDSEQSQSTSNKSISEPAGGATKQMSGVKEGNGAGDDLMEHVRSTASEAYDSATSKASQKLEEQKTTLSSGLSNVATSMRKFGKDFENVDSDDPISKITAEYSQLAANKLEQAVGYFDRKDLNAMYRDVEDLARQYPAWFVGGAFAVGFIAARFLKSSNARSYSSSEMSYHPNMPQQTRSGAQIQTTTS